MWSNCSKWVFLPVLIVFRMFLSAVCKLPLWEILWGHNIAEEIWSGGLMVWSSYLSLQLFTASKGGWIGKKINPIIWICLFHWMKGNIGSQVTGTCYSLQGTGDTRPLCASHHWQRTMIPFPSHASSPRQSLEAALQRWNLRLSELRERLLSTAPGLDQVLSLFFKFENYLIFSIFFL